MKKTIPLLLSLLLILSLCACQSLENTLEAIQTPAPKTFTTDGLTIDLNDDFFRMDALAQDYDFCLSSGDMVILGLWVEVDCENPLSLWEYAAAFRQTMDKETMTEITDLNGFPTMQYQSVDDEGNAKTNFIVIYDGGNGYWLLQYIFDTADYNTMYSAAQQYAQSVKCDETRYKQ